MRLLIASTLFLLLSTSCTPAHQSDGIQADTVQKKSLEGLSTAYFASGCFWCVEAVFESVVGVEEAVSGYAGGHTDNPTYRSIGTGSTGHSESVEVYYNPDVVSFETLLKVFYGSHDPTTVEGQAPDYGSQYRSIIFYQNESEKQLAEQAKQDVTDSGAYDKAIVTEITELEKFYPAEDYHQDYERLHPNESYVRNVSVPRLNHFKKKFPDLLKKEH